MELNIYSWLSPQPFEAELEKLYQNDLRSRVFRQVKLSILIGTLVFLTFIVNDLTNPLFHKNISIRIPYVLFGLGLWLFIHVNPERAAPWILYFALMGAISAILGQLSMLAGYDARLYLHSASSAMYIIAFIYGPLYVPIRSGTILCLIYLASLIMLGIRNLIPSNIIFVANFHLLFMIIVSLFSRYQLEVFARRSFSDKRAADLARRLADEKRQQAEQANQEKATFLRNASHNLRQPTQALSSYTLLLETALQAQNLASAREATQNLTYAVDLLGEAFDKILDISRVDRDDYTPTVSRVFINDLLDTISRQYSQIAVQKGLRLKIRHSNIPPTAIFSDKYLLQQIISNLVDNALKYTKQGWVLLATKKSKYGIRIHVIDSGVGISNQHKQAIFQPFFRGNEQSDEPGMGIGLSYVEKAIGKLPLHRLGYYSKPGRGTHFYIDVPVATENDVPIDLQEHPIIALDPGTYILIVDDNKLVLDALEKHLTTLGCVIETATSCIEVQQILKDTFRTFDLVFTDYKLAGDETAEDIVRILRDFNGDIPVVVLTGENFYGETILLLAKEYPLLRKPVSSVRLTSTITKMISSGSK